MGSIRTVRSYRMKLEAGPADIFPLLCPVREYEWIQPWDCEMLYTGSGRAELDCVFKTSFPEDGPEDTWVVSKYEPPARIEFVRINSLRSIRYSIELSQQGDGTSEAVWQQVITGLSFAGDKFVAGCSDEAFHNRMAMLQNMLNHFLKTGEMLKIME